MSVSNALQAAGASSAFWIILALVLIVATIGYVLTRRGGMTSAGASADSSRLVQDWLPTGRIDFAGPSGEPADADTPGSFYLQAEETRVLVSLSGIERKEIRWRRATLNEAKRVVNVFHRQLPRSPLRMLDTDAAPSIASNGAASPKPAVRDQPAALEQPTVRDQKESAPPVEEG
jgi:hypothetical protein